MPTQPSRLKLAQQAVSLLAGGMVLLSVVAVLFTQTSPTDPSEPAPGEAAAQFLPKPELTTPFAIIAALLLAAAIAVPLAMPGPVRRRAHARWRGRSGEEAEDSVLTAYRTYSVARMLPAEAFGLFCAVSTIVTGELAFLGGVLIALVIIGAVFPSRRGEAEFYRRVTGQPIPAHPE